ncbi:MAG TPA: LuxR C-terminal-related transcriptional regulator [Steroidobacteraceae bacterium]|nr:LuxR C-terminal-related transcriptional regulator [Steroidobacteraceae bacterium]
MTGEETSRVSTYKLVAPSPVPGAVRRNEILERVAASPQAVAVVLQAPAGHGKSTALQQLKEAADGAGARTGWLTLESGDNDPQRFFLHFQALLTRIAGSEAKRFPDRDLVNFPNRCDWLIETLAAIGRPVALFLDEFQNISDRDVLNFLRTVFERAPPDFRVFVGSRTLPDIGLARMAVNNRALLLHGDHLRFSPKEVERFFGAAVDLGVDLDEIDAIYRRTEGWPAALQLFKLTLGSPHVRRSLGGDDPGAPRELTEYLAENVLALQSERIQHFLLHTAELPRLHPSLCDTVLDCTDSLEILLHLERSGMFLRCVDPQGGWYKYHTLFSSILAAQQRAADAAEVHEIHRRAAGWFMQRRLFEDTVRHATVCGDWTLAADALNVWSSDLVADAHLRTLETWSEGLPFEEVQARPDLAIKVAYALVFLRRRQRARPLLQFLQQRSGTGSVLETTDPNIILSIEAVSSDDIPRALRVSEQVPLHRTEARGFAAFELGAAANLRGYCALATQEYESAQRYLALAMRHNEQVHAAFSHGYTVAVDAVALLLKGSLQEALKRFRTELSEHPVIDKSLAAAALLSCYIWALYEANELDTAEQVFQQNHDIISDSTLTDFLTVAFLSSARVQDARGRSARADAILEEAEAIGRNTGWTRLVDAVKWERVRRALLRCAVDLAGAIADSTSSERLIPPDWIMFASDVEERGFGEIRLALARGRLERAADLLQSELRRQRGRVLRQIKLHLLSAVHAQRAGDPSGQKRHLATGLRLARGGGFIRAVLDEGEPVLQMLHERYQGGQERDRSPPGADPDRPFVEALLRACGSSPGQPSGALHIALQPLTERERGILVLLGNGTSNKDMANRLYVSENTVKFHLKNIYAKLSVTSRVQAIAAARRMGIIH